MSESDPHFGIGITKDFNPSHTLCLRSGNFSLGFFIDFENLNLNAYQILD